MKRSIFFNEYNDFEIKSNRKRKKKKKKNLNTQRLQFIINVIFCNRLR